MTASGRGDSVAATDSCTEHVGWGSQLRRMHTKGMHGTEPEAPFRPALLSELGSRSAPVCAVIFHAKVDACPEDWGTPNLCMWTDCSGVDARHACVTWAARLRPRCLAHLCRR